MNVEEIQESIEKLDLPDEVTELIGKMAETIVLQEEEIETLGKSDGGGTESTESVLKGADESIHKLFAEQEARIAEAESIAKAERDSRLDREYADKASRYGVLGDTSDIAKTLRKLHDTDVDAEILVTKIFDVASDLVRKSGAFAEVGQAVGIQSNVLDSAIEKAVASGKTREQAFAEAVEANPALYDDFLAGR